MLETILETGLAVFLSAFASGTKNVTNIEKKNTKHCHQHKVNNIHLSPTSM